MPLLLRYLRETGAIVATWQSNSLEVLRAQQVEDDDTHSSMLYLGAVAASTLEHDYYVVDGVLLVRPAAREDG